MNDFAAKLADELHARFAVRDVAPVASSVFVGSDGDVQVVMKVRCNRKRLLNEVRATFALRKVGIQTPEPIRIHGQYLNGFKVGRRWYWVFFTVRVGPVDDQKYSQHYYSSAGVLLAQIQVRCARFLRKFPRCEWTAGQEMEPELQERQSALRRTLSNIAPAEKSYGISHNDYHSGNLIYSDGSIVVTDLEYFGGNFLDSDITNVAYELFHSSNPNREASRDAFLAGYAQEAQRCPNREVAAILAKLNDLSEIVAGTGNTTNDGDRRNRLFDDVLSDEEDGYIRWFFE